MTNDQPDDQTVRLMTALEHEKFTGPVHQAHYQGERAYSIARLRAERDGESHDEADRRGKLAFWTAYWADLAEEATVRAETAREEEDVQAMSDYPSIDDYFAQTAPTSRAVIRAQQAQADAEGVSLAVIQQRARDARQAADQAAQAQRNADAATALERLMASPGWPTLPPGSPPSMKPVYRELQRQAVERARLEAEEAAPLSYRH